MIRRLLYSSYVLKFYLLNGSMIRNKFYAGHVLLSSIEVALLHVGAVWRLRLKVRAVEVRRFVRCWGSHFFWKIGSQKAVGLSASRPGRPLPPGKFLVLISVRCWVDPKAIVWLERLGKLKIIHLIGIQSRDLPACSIVPEQRYRR
jgi:hypothetical protein